MAKIVPIFFLLLITPILGESLPGNTPFGVFLHVPMTYLFMVIAYGVSILIIREAVVRWKLSIWGILILGIAYGIYNEGIIAHTLYMQHAPIGSFSNYLYAFGFNFSWTTTILLYHTLHSVLYPLLIAAFVFPARSREPWLSKSALMGGIFLSIVMLFFFPTSLHPFLPQVIPSFIAIVMLVILARVCRAPESFLASHYIPRGIGKAAIWGAIYIFLFASTFMLAQLNIFPILYFAAIAGLLCLTYFTMKKTVGLSATTLLAFGLGDYGIIALQNILKNPAPDMRIGETVLVIGFGILLTMLIKRQPIVVR